LQFIDINTAKCEKSVFSCNLFLLPQDEKLFFSIIINPNYTIKLTGEIVIYVTEL